MANGPFLAVDGFHHSLEHRITRTMTDGEIRARIRERFAAGTLPRRIILDTKLGAGGPANISVGNAFPDRCAVCGVRTTQLLYYTPGQVFAFHQRCHDIWKEEADRRSAR